jgi:DNA-binding response OmpR family regulator
VETNRREQIQRSLRSLTDLYKSMIELMERTFALLCEESSLDPFSYFQKYPLQSDPHTGRQRLLIDRAVFSVKFKGKACFLGNRLPFKLLARLAQRPNTYVSYKELLSEAWDDVIVSESAIRSVVRNLRNKLRQAGLADLARAIDGTVPRHYALKLDL